MGLKCHEKEHHILILSSTVALKWTFSFPISYSSNISSLFKRKTILKIIVKEHAGINFFILHTHNTHIHFFGKITQN